MKNKINLMNIQLQLMTVWINEPLSHLRQGFELALYFEEGYWVFRVSRSWNTEEYQKFWNDERIKELGEKLGLKVKCIFID